MAVPRFGMFKNPVRQQGAQQIYKMQNRLNSGLVPEDRIPRVSERLTGLQTKFTQPIQKKIDKFGNRISTLQGRLDGGTLNANQTQRVTDRLGRVTKRQGKLQGLLTPYGTQAPAPQEQTPVAQTPYVEQPPAQNSPEYQKQIDDYMKALFPQTDAYNMDKYLTAMEPARSYEEGRQTDALTKYMAAHGGRSSGFAAQKLQDQNAQIGADFNNRAFDYASQARNRDQGNAERLRGVLTDEAERAARGEQNNFDNRMRILENMLSQGQTLLGYGYGAAGQSANLTADYGKNRADLQSNEYMQMPPMGAFPTGQTPTPGFVPPFPSQPDQTNANIAGLVGGQSSSSGMLDAISGGLGVLDSTGLLDNLFGGLF